MAEGSRVGTGTFDTSGFVKAKVFHVAITLAIGAMGKPPSSEIAAPTK
jgi:hypothetical protein